jgi:hypothetical protein
MAVGFGTLCNCRYKVRGDYFLYFDLVRCCPLGLGRGHPLRCQLLCLVAQAFSFSSSWALLISSWWSGAVGSRPTWPTWPRGAGERSELDTAAAISPASGSRPTTAEPPAPPPGPAQQGSEAVLSSSTPLFVRTARRPAACWRRGSGVRGEVGRYCLKSSYPAWLGTVIKCPTTRKADSFRPLSSVQLP